jgi:tetratricopeptide (TPR) repeat protein
MRLAFALLVAFASMALAEASAGRADERVDLLKLPIAAPAVNSAAVVAGTSLGALIDGDPSTAARFDVEGGGADLVFSFGGATVTCERLVVRLPAELSEGPSAIRAEVLVSTLSPQAGFVSVRSDPLEATDGPQRFDFPPAAARWLMLRLTVREGGEEAALAEASILGHEGPPATRYAFDESPADAFEVLARLREVSSLDLAVAPDEEALFADAADGRLDDWTFAEAALMASGAADRATREAYLRQLDRLASQAERALAGAASDFDKGERLLAFLHAAGGPFGAGYESEQTDLTRVLDEQTFNCVSSAVLYNILAERAGLDARAIEVPDHAFSILYDGTRHADVETTTEGGFNPARDPAAQAEFQRQTGFAYIPDSHRDQRREIGPAGLAAIIYYNHGVVLNRQKRHHEALLAYFRAMSLDREFDSAVKNALASLANWSGELAAGLRFEEAISVLATGLALAPQDEGLKHNRTAIWTDWALAEAGAGRDDAALAVLRRAAQDFPDGDFARRQAWIYLARGEALAETGDWLAAMAAVDPGLAKVDPPARAELVEWRGDVWLRWADRETDAGRFAEAVDVLARAAAENPGEARFGEQLAYVVQEWLADTRKRQDEATARRIIVGQRQRFPQLDDLADVAEGHVQRMVRDCIEAEQYDEAQAIVQRNHDLLSDADAARELTAWINHRQSRALSDKSEWAQAVRVHEATLAARPGDEDALKSLVYTVYQWAEAVLAEQGEAAAREVLAEQLVRFPQLEGVREVAEGHAYRVVRRLADAGDYREALRSAADHAVLFADPADARKPAYYVYDTWARASRDKGDWRAALAVYGDGLKAFPGDEHLANNAAVSWYRWARFYIDL